MAMNQHWFRLWLVAKQGGGNYLNEWWHNSLRSKCLTRHKWVSTFIGKETAVTMTCIFEWKHNHLLSHMMTEIMARLMTIILPNYIWLAEQTHFNSLGAHDAIWRWRSRSTLVQVMACCLMAPSQYLNQCWLIISKVLRHSSEDIIMRRFEDTNQESKIEDDIFKITLRSPRGQWVDTLHMVLNNSDYLLTACSSLQTVFSEFW